MFVNMSATDLELLARYTRHGAEDAFEIARRYVNLVYSAALRQTRSTQLAEEIAQSTFIKLAQQGQQTKVLSWPLRLGLQPLCCENLCAFTPQSL
jgi:DNA-directed RNA polymerase specialized sigma24 family protein